MKRVLSPEVMDDPALPKKELDHALRGLARLNAVSGAARVTIGAVARAAGPRPCRVLDVACASGDFALRLASYAKARSLAWRVSGCDVNPLAIAHATSRARDMGVDADFFTCDVIEREWKGAFDVAVCSLFLHHLEREQAQALLARMARHARTVIVNDLVRSAWNAVAIGAASRLLTRSRVVHTDAVLSARAAWTRREILEIAERAGLSGATISFGGISRMMLVWSRPE
ncbi:MAG: methyltransferase domain-containing protein [Phycisphaerales bacterium]